MPLVNRIYEESHEVDDKKAKKKKNQLITTDNSDNPLSMYMYQQQKAQEKEQKQAKYFQEMLEVVMIFDHEFQQNFKNIIFHLVLQKFHDDIHKYIIIINKAYFMLEEEPKFDKPEPLHLCIFYDKVDYSLTELYNLLIHEKLRLNEDCLVKMGVQLIQILHGLYSKYLYRLNINMDTIFYSTQTRSFKLQSFNRIKSLVSFNKQAQLKVYDLEYKVKKRFCKAFQKDQMAVFDTLLQFQIIRMELDMRYQDLKNAKQAVKQELAYGLRFKPEHDKMKIFLSSCFQSYSRIEQVKQRLENLREMISDLTKNQDQSGEEEQFIISKEERMRLEEEYNKLQMDQEAKSQKSNKEEEDEYEDDEEDDYDDENEEDDDNQNGRQQKARGSYSENKPIDDIRTFNIIFSNCFDKDDGCYGVCPLQITETELQYQQTMLDSLFNRQNTKQYDHSLKQTISLLQKNVKKNTKNNILKLKLIYCLYLKYCLYNNSKQILDKAYNTKLQCLGQIFTYVQQVNKDTQDPLYFQLLFSLITVFMKMLPFKFTSFLVQQLHHSLHLQKKIKEKYKDRLLPDDFHKGIIETKKSSIFDILLTEVYISCFDYNQAFHSIQKAQKVLRAINKKYEIQMIFSAYTLYIFGKINSETLSLQTAMLSLEKAKQAYINYFPNNNQINISEIEFYLGSVYLEMRVYKNSIRCLKNSFKISSQYYADIDDNILGVLIKMFEIFVEQENQKDALKYSTKYLKISNKLFKKQGIPKSKIFAQFQFIMGAVFQANGLMISAIKSYQRSLRTYEHCRDQNTFLNNLYLQYKVKLCLREIYQLSLIANGIIGKSRSDIFKGPGFNTLTEMASCCFNKNARVPALLPSKSNILSSSLIFANFHIQKKQYQLAEEVYKTILQETKDKVSDGNFGQIMYNMGQLNMINQQWNDAIKCLRQAVKAQNNYLHTPFKEYSMLKTFQLLILAYGIAQEYNNVIQLISDSNQLIRRFQKKMKWNQKIRQSRSHDIPNKFLLILRGQGEAALYQLQQLMEFIYTFQQMINKLDPGIDENEKLGPLCLEYYLSLKNVSTSKQQVQLTKNRTTLLRSTNLRVSIAPPSRSSQILFEKLMNDINDDEFVKQEERRKKKEEKERKRKEMEKKARKEKKKQEKKEKKKKEKKEKKDKKEKKEKKERKDTNESGKEDQQEKKEKKERKDKKDKKDDQQIEQNQILPVKSTLKKTNKTPASKGVTFDEDVKESQQKETDEPIDLQFRMASSITRTVQESDKKAQKQSTQSQPQQVQYQQIILKREKKTISPFTKLTKTEAKKM